MPKFCIYEQHAGICVKTGNYCNEGVCPYEDIRDFAEVVPDVGKKLREYDVLAGLLYMMGKATNVVTEPELKKLVTGLTGKGEEFYKAVDDFVANECGKRRLEMEAEK